MVHEKPKLTTRAYQYYPVSLLKQQKSAWLQVAA